MHFSAGRRENSADLLIFYVNQYHLLWNEQGFLLIYKPIQGRSVTRPTISPIWNKMLVTSRILNLFSKIRILREAENTYYSFPVRKSWLTQPRVVLSGPLQFCLLNLRYRPDPVEFTFCESYIIQKLGTRVIGFCGYWESDVACKAGGQRYGN